MDLRHTPQGARLLAIGPSVANVLEFYGHHQVSALSVSTNPHNRNPAYTPVPNPDLALRNGDFQYIVWDAYTAARTRSSPARPGGWPASSAAWPSYTSASHRPARGRPGCGRARHRHL